MGALINPAALGLPDVSGRIVPPPDFPWPWDAFPVQLYRVGGRIVSDINPDAYIFAGCWSAVPIHVDPLYGDDTRNGVGACLGDFSGAVKTAARAYTLASAAGATCGRIVVKNRGWAAPLRLGAADTRVWTAPAIPLLIEGIDGQAISLAARSYTWTLDQGSTYKCTEASTLSRGLNLADLDADGNPAELPVAASLAACRAATVTGAVYQTGGEIYVTRPGGGAVTDANTAVTLAVNNLQLTQTAKSGTALRNMRLVGGYCLDIMHNTPLTATARDFVVDGVTCTHSVSGYSTFRLRDSPGRILLVDIEGYYSGTDHVNLHWTNTGVACTMYPLVGTINRPSIRLRWAGKGTAGVSCNNYANHDNVVGIAWGLDGRFAAGAGISLIDQSKGFFADCRDVDSVGDTYKSGGSTPPQAVQLDNDAEAWMDGGAIGSSVSYVNARLNTRLHLRGTRILAGVATLANAAQVINQ